MRKKETQQKPLMGWGEREILARWGRGEPMGMHVCMLIRSVERENYLRPTLSLSIPYRNKQTKKKALRSK